MNRIIRIFSVLALLSGLVTLTAGVSMASPKAGSSYSLNGWAGYSWPDGSGNWAAADFTVPHFGSPDGAVAFWAGLGRGNPGIQQDGVSCGWANGVTSCNAWYEMWPASPHAFGYRVEPGDHMRFIVLRFGTRYVLKVVNYTRAWTARTIQYSSDVEYSGEAIAEAFGPEPPGFTAASFSRTSGAISNLYSWPFGGEYSVPDGSYSFTIHRT